MQNNYNTLINEMNGVIRWRLLEYAIGIRLFDMMSVWKTSKDISFSLQTDSLKTGIYLDALVSCGYLIKYCGKYKNADISEKYLITKSRMYQGNLVLSLASRRLKGFDSVHALLQKGAEPSVHLSDENVWEEAFRGLIPFQRAIADKVLSLLEALDGIEAFSKMLDLGGGPGCIGQAIVSKYKNMSLALLDLPKVIQLAKENTESSGIEYVAGDYSSVDMGGGYDLIWASRSLYYAKDVKKLISTAAEALKTGGYLITLHEGLYNERTEPQEIVLNRIGPALNGSDVSFSRCYLEWVIHESGLKNVSVVSTQEFGGNADIITARKE